MSHLETTKSNLKRLASDSLELALKELERILSPESDRFHAFLLLKGQFKKCREEFLLGMLSQEQNTQIYARLLSAFLQLTNEMVIADLIPEKETAQKSAEKRGELLYHVPHTMQVMREERCTVRIAWTESALFENWHRKKDDIHRRNLRIAEIMGVELMSFSEDAPFSIKCLHSTVQFLDEEEYTEWIFYVKPLRAGNYPLLIRISVIEMRDNREVKRELVLEEQISITTEAPQVEAGEEDMISAPLSYFAVGAPFVEAPAFLTEVVRRYGGLIALLFVSAIAITWPNRQLLPDDTPGIVSKPQPDTLQIVLPETGSNKSTEEYGGIHQKKNHEQNDRGIKTHPAVNSPLGDSEDIAPNLDVIQDNYVTPLDTMPQYMKDSVEQSRLQTKMQLLRLVQDDNGRDTAEFHDESIEQDRLRSRRFARVNHNLAVLKRTLQQDPTMAIRMAEFSVSVDSGNRTAFLIALGGRGGVYSRLPAFSPNGNSILTGSQDNTMRLWHFNDTDTLRHSLNWHINDINRIPFPLERRYSLGDKADKTAHSLNIPKSETALLDIGSIGRHLPIGAAVNPPYKLAVHGSIIAEDVNVQLNSDWPDYIFSPKYKLLSRDSMNSVLKRNEHLPEMPTGIDSTKHLQLLSEELLREIEKINHMLDTFKNQTNKIALNLNKMEVLAEPSKVKRKGFFTRFWDWLIFWK